MMGKTLTIERPRSELDQLTEQIIGSAYTISNSQGIGFLEKVYENAMVVELKNRGLRIDQQNTYRVRYKDVVVGKLCGGYDR
ncbi:MAG TPA: GxxExxY protein [Anaerolineales bacterium]|nr:GxxExxY protein [Anaerolineales bacterium]